MPPEDESGKTLEQVAEEIGIYPIEAYEFVREGLAYTVNKIHGPREENPVKRHVSGQQLCQGLREFALLQWGMLAGTVLRRWNINSTTDFGRIVFALIDSGFMQKTQDDTLDDFRNVYDFKQAFDSDYNIEAKNG